MACGYLKISHEGPQLVMSIINKLKKRYGNEAPLTVKHGKVHNYLGMTLDFLSPKKMRILMLDYILKLLDDLPEEYGGEVVTPAVNHLLEVNDDTKN
jgi:hypothetical protein